MEIGQWEVGRSKLQILLCCAQNEVDRLFGCAIFSRNECIDLEAGADHRFEPRQAKLRVVHLEVHSLVYRAMIASPRIHTGNVSFG